MSNLRSCDNARVQAPESNPLSPPESAEAAASTSRPATQAPWPRPGSSLSLALRAVPGDRRELSATWLSWWHETARIPLTIEDIGVAQAKLSWWASAVQEAATGESVHPLLKAMCRANAQEADTAPPWITPVAGSPTSAGS